MTLVKRNSFLPKVHQFDDFFSKELFDWQLQNNSSITASLPAVNIIEGNEDFMVELAAPGMNKKDFLIELDNDVLKISSTIEETKQLKEGDRYNHREFNYHSFRRSIHLSKTVVDESKIKAKYENGILRVLIPKKEEAKILPPRQINVA